MYFISQHQPHLELLVAQQLLLRDERDRERRQRRGEHHERHHQPEWTEDRQVQ